MSSARLVSVAAEIARRAPIGPAQYFVIPADLITELRETLDAAGIEWRDR